MSITDKNLESYQDSHPCFFDEKHMFKTQDSTKPSKPTLTTQHGALSKENTFITGIKEYRALQAM